MSNLTASTEHWLTIVVLLGTIFGAMWRVWRKHIKPALDRQADESAWVREQMTANGLARRAGTANDTLRDALDRNTRDTKNVADKLDQVRRENAKALDAVAEIERQHHAENQEALRTLRERER